jgi:two-component system, OmpR family, phosphate regulon sensor histidine kinase PhoR
MDTKAYKVLLIEDDKIDQMAFVRMVKEEKLPFDYIIIDTVEGTKKILSDHRFDVIISDYNLKDGTAFEILDSVKDTPIIFATGAGNEKLAVKAMKAGAYDYLIKNAERSYLAVLPMVIENAINHAKMEKEVKDYHENLEEIVKHRTEQLEQEKELLSVTFSSMTDGVVVTDAQKKIVLLNKVAEQLIGIKLDAAKDKPIDDVMQLLDERSREPVENPVDQALATGEVANRIESSLIIQKNNRQYPVLAAAAPICKNQGIVRGAVVRGAVMLLHDLSAEREIDRMKTDFVSSISHELRTPLTSIKAYTETILRDSNMPEPTKHEFLVAIDEESNRLAELVNGLLEISQLQSGKAQINEQNIDISKTIKKIVSSLKYTADKKNIRLEIAGDNTNIMFIGDEAKIYSMFSNLINNAIKFTPAGGLVSISIKQQDMELIVKVSDTGIGIPKEELSKIFQRFYRVKQQGKQIPGTGLGLAIVSEVAALHNGKVEVESNLGQGTTFTVILPFRQDCINNTEKIAAAVN